MQGSETFDGKISGNRQLVDRYNEAKGKKPGAPKKSRPKPGGGFSGGAHEPSGHDEIKQVVAEHGPAHSHHIHKTPDGYHSTSHHESGHVHHADHATLGEAHEHGAHAYDDTTHLGDMGKDDEQVAGEHARMEEGGSGSSYGGTKSVGFMS